MSQGRGMVLAITDSRETIALLSQALASRCGLAAAHTAASAAAAAISLLPDLILVDSMLPDASVMESLERLMHEPLLRGIPTILLERSADPTLARHAFASGICDCIAVPQHSEQLAARICVHLELKACRDQIACLAAERMAELVKTREALIAGLAGLAGSRDLETGRHTGRIMPLVRCLAISMRRRGVRLSDAAIEWITLASQLHDIGKVAVPDSILRKPGRLTVDEFAWIKRHTVIGGAVIDRAEQCVGRHTLLRLASEIALSHHENWDGSGYPYGLQGEAIPLGARVVALVDVYDALTSDRPYKRALPHVQAVAVILNGDGRTSPAHFAPDVLSAFADCADQFSSQGLQFQPAPLPNDVNPLQC